MTKFKIEKWADNEGGWDTDTGNPGIMYVANAIQAWSSFNHPHECTVDEAARVFNLEIGDVQAAIEAHPWMFISVRQVGYGEAGYSAGETRQFIEHDGD